ncbi:MAG: MATE family efflux transporter [Proteobacteria bacterium]|nr:MATE family efflux transporter [Pseudomonadota bacterium]HQR04969.1 MATE family efflux transporter [Rhodocyclaceae bacterium]
MRALIHLAWPTFVAQIAVMLNGMIDTVMAGHLSSTDLAAIGIGAAVYGAIFVSLTGILIALTPHVAHLYGAGKREEIGEEVRQAAWLALALGALIILLMAWPDPLLAIARLTPPVEVKVRDYLAALAWSVPPALTLRLFNGLSSGIGRPRPIMLLNLLGLALKIPANLVFMYGHLGLPALGATGCGVASSLIAWLLAALAWLWLARLGEYRDYALLARFSPPRWSALRDLVRLGLPIGATFMMDVTAFTFMALFIARFGAVASGAHQIAANLAALLFMLPTSIGHAAGVLSGQALGSGDPAAARRAAQRGFLLGLGCGATTALALALAREPAAAFYTADPEVRQLAARLLLLVAIYHLADALQGVAVNVLRGYKKAGVPMVIYAFALWGVGLGGGIVVGLNGAPGLSPGPVGFWLAAIAGLGLAGLLVTLYCRRVIRLTVAPQAAAP